jgi:hypothetical protein
MCDGTPDHRQQQAPHHHQSHLPQLPRESCSQSAKSNHPPAQHAPLIRPFRHRAAHVRGGASWKINKRSVLLVLGSHRLKKKKEKKEIGYWLLSIGSRLLAIGYCLLSVACCLLPIGYWLLAIGYCLLAIVYWLLSIGYCLLSIGYCLLAIVMLL